MGAKFSCTLLGGEDWKPGSVTNLRSRCRTLWMWITLLFACHPLGVCRVLEKCSVGKQSNWTLWVFHTFPIPQTLALVSLSDSKAHVGNEAPREARVREGCRSGLHPEVWFSSSHFSSLYLRDKRMGSMEVKGEGISFPSQSTWSYSLRSSPSINSSSGISMSFLTLLLTPMVRIRLDLLQWGNWPTVIKNDCQLTPGLHVISLNEDTFHGQWSLHTLAQAIACN